MKKSISFILSLIMVMATLTALPYTATAATYQTGGISVSDEFAAWGINSDPIDTDIYYYNNGTPIVNSYKGMSYDTQTNTLTLNNVPYTVNTFMLTLTDMGNLTVNVIGNNGLANMSISDTNVTITGTGTLVLNPAMSYTLYEGTVNEERYTNEHICDQPINAENSTLQISNTVTVDIQNGHADSYSASLLFHEPQEADKVFTYGGNVSSKPAVKTTVEEASSYDVADMDNTTLHIKHQFAPSGKIYRLKGYEGENNYWIVSSVDYQGANNLFYSRLEERDGGWFEVTDGKSYRYQNGSYTIYDFSDYTESQPETEVVFEPYNVNELPNGLNGEVATAYVRPVTDSYGNIYKKNGKDYVLWLTLQSGYYNAALAPTNLAKTGHEYAYVMFEIKTLGNQKYLEFAEDLGHYAESFDNAQDYYDYCDEAKAIAQNKGYTQSVTTYEVPASYRYEITNNKLRFTPGTVQKTDISKCTVSGVKDKAYTGKAITQTITIKDGSVTLKNGTDYTVAYKNNTKVGTATVVITGKGEYMGTKSVIFKITKAANPLTLKAKKPTVKFSTVKKKNQTIALEKWATVSKAQGKVTFKKSSGNKKITVSKAGKITVKKGLKKGTYKVKIKVTAAGNASYKAKSKTVTVTIKVK